MKKLLFLLTIGFVMSAVAAPLEVPEECQEAVEEGIGCHHSTFEVGPATELDRDVIHVNFFASISEYDEEEILESFLDFESWGDKTAIVVNGNVKAALSKSDVAVVESITLDETAIYNGREAIVNHAHYYTKAPFPLGKLEVVERALYFEIEPEDDAIFTWKFVADPNFPKNSYIDFDGTQKQTTGIVYKTGTLSLYFDEENEVYLAYVKIEVIPEIDFLPSLAAPYVSAGLESVFIGLFAE